MPSHTHTPNLQDIYGGGTHLVKFSSPICGPCRAAAIVVDRISADERFSGVSFWEVNVADPINGEMIRQLNIRSVPVVVIVKDGENRKIIVGGEVTDTVLEDTLLALTE
jgi:thiol-disulfide isomerase/thioredoxin